MGEPSKKKQKTASKSENASHGPRITDPRFANIQYDPRYRLPGKKDKVKLDKRFSRVLQDEDFTKRAKVDRYGRTLESNAEKTRLKRQYDFDDEEEEEEKEEDSDAPDDDDEVQKELNRLEASRDLLREGRDSESSSDETSSDEDDEEEDGDEIEDQVGLDPSEQTDIPTGEVTARMALVNLDWDNIRAADLMAVFSSFLPASGSLLKVAIYPSEFGKERLEREEMEGPPKEIFADGGMDMGDEESEEEDDEDIKKSILKPDDGAEFDSSALRRYQLDRLRYFYAVLTFSSPAIAKHIYDAVDGTEYLRTANFFDLRFVPDDTDFSSDRPREECEKIPGDYRPNEFVTDALQHSKVKLTWDAEDGGRKEAVARAFKGGRREIEENDLQAYLASDSSEDEEEDENPDEDLPLSKKEKERQRMRALLGLAPEPEKRSKKDKVPVGDMQITFTSGLSAANEDGEKKKKKKRSVFENSPEPDETTVEKYIRKERERKQKRKDKQKTAPGEGEAEEGDDSVVPDTQDDAADAAADDLGFDDPFFAATEPSGAAEKAASNKMRKEERMKKKKEREAEEEAERKQRAELELLMADDDAENNAGGKPKIRHFDMREVEKAEKEARKKGKHRKKPTKKSEAAAADAEGGNDGFEMDTADPRFARLFDSHEYAIDPTNPRFKGTKGMRDLLEEGRRRKSSKTADTGLDGDEGGKTSNKKDKEKTGQGKDEVKSLVEKIKRQQQQTQSQPETKSQNQGRDAKSKQEKKEKKKEKKQKKSKA